MFNNQFKKLASEELVSFDLLNQGFMVLKPVTNIIENYDLVVEKNGTFYKIQVKSALEDEKNRMRVDIRRSSASNTGRHYEENAYDILAIVNLEKKTTCYIHKGDLTAKHSINIWCCEFKEIPTKGRWTGHVPFIFKNHLECPIR